MNTDDLTKPLTETETMTPDQKLDWLVEHLQALEQKVAVRDTGPSLQNINSQFDRVNQQLAALSEQQKVFAADVKQQFQFIQKQNDNLFVDFQKLRAMLGLYEDRLSKIEGQQDSELAA